MTWRRLTQIELLEQNHSDSSSWINDIHNHDWNPPNPFKKDYIDHHKVKTPPEDPWDKFQKHLDWTTKSIENAHKNGTHSTHCTPIVCWKVRQSHATDHALCGRDCETAQQRHESGDHHSCVPWYCRTALQLKAWMQLAEGLD